MFRLRFPLLALALLAEEGHRGLRVRPVEFGWRSICCRFKTLVSGPAFCSRPDEFQKSSIARKATLLSPCRMILFVRLMLARRRPGRSRCVL